MIIRPENIIGNEFSAKGESTFRSYNPSLNQEIDATYYIATAEEVEQACILAQKASKPYFQIGVKKRTDFLNKVIFYIQENQAELLRWFVQESGLNEARAKLELDRTIFQIKTYAVSAEKLYSTLNSEAADPPIHSIKREYFPLGPIAVFGASNFPFAYSTAGGDTASALAAGCPVIVKGHPLHPITGHLVAQCIQKAAIDTGMPEGVFSYLNSNAIQVGQQLVLNEAVKGVGFTGSIKGGRAIFDLAAKRETLIPVFAEMGSVNPVFISKKSLKQGNSWAEEYAKSITLGVGQFCTSPGLIFGLNSGEFDDFANRLNHLLETTDEQVMLGSSIKENFTQGLTKIGVELDATSSPNAIKPTMKVIEAKEFLNNSDFAEEYFGSFCVLVKCTDLEEVESCAQFLKGQLTCSLIAQEDELKEMSDLIYTLKSKCGRLIFNGVSTGVAVHPFQQHGGPYPASTDSRFTAVGDDAIMRWVRPIAVQNAF